MSTISKVHSRAPSKVSSILKSSQGSIREQFENRQNQERTVRFILPHVHKAKQILQEYASENNRKEYEQLVCSIRDTELEDGHFIKLLTDVSECLSILNQDYKLFVEAVLNIRWAHRNDVVVKKFQSFVVNLLSAHNYHAKMTLDRLVVNFYPDDDTEWPDGIPTNADNKKLANVHSLIMILIEIIPMARELFMQVVTYQYPYIKKSPHVHEYYLHNLLWLLDYKPEFRSDIFLLIFDKMVLLDVNAPREEIMDRECNYGEEIFDMEVDYQGSENDVMKHPLGHALDLCLDKIFNHLIVECHDVQSGQLNWDKTKNVYQDMVEVFERVILPTYDLHHVSFVMFFVCSFRGSLAEAFITYLWKKVCTPNVAVIHRQTAVSYISGLLARAAFIPLNLVKGTMKLMADFVHSYIAAQDGVENVKSDVRVHGIFFSVCQAIFYLVAFKHRELVKNRKNVSFLESLNLSKMVTCRLNPLRVCQPVVVQNFAAVTRKYQLAYCYSIIEHNSRNTIPVIYEDERGYVTTVDSNLDTFFPLDPYLLKRSGKKIMQLYIEYRDDLEEEASNTFEKEEDDDFLHDQTAAKKRKFSYGSSPGFKHGKEC